MAGLAAELEDQNVINEGYLSSAECNALVVSTCRAPLRKVTRLVRPPAGADDHMVTRFFSDILLKQPAGIKQARMLRGVVVQARSAFRFNAG